MSRELRLTRGLVALVDDEDFAWAQHFRWYARPSTRNGKTNFYAARTGYFDGVRRMVYLHRAILGLARGDLRQGDHKNHDTLDNRRSNLRVCSASCNMQNQAPRGRVGMKGVIQYRGRFRAQIRVSERNMSLGEYVSAEDAARAYDAAAVRHFGDGAWLNFADRLAEPAPERYRPAPRVKRVVERRPPTPQPPRWGEDHPLAALSDALVAAYRAAYIEHIAGRRGARVARGWMAEAAEQAGLPYHTYRKIVKGRGYPSAPGYRPECREASHA